MLRKFVYNFNQNKKISNKYIFDSKTIGYLLTFIAGMLGVYTFKLSGGVFGNGLTGDVLYIGINIAKKETIIALKYLFVVVSFSIGVIISYYIRKKFQSVDVDENAFRRIGLIIETLLILISYFVKNNVACLFILTVSLGIQIEIFDSIRGYGLSTVNYVGNTKAAAEYVGKFITGDNKDGLLIAVSYYIAFWFFMIGGALSSILYDNIGKLVSLVCALIMLFIFVLSIVLIKDKKKDKVF